MVRLQDINKENYGRVVRLELTEKQKEVIATNLESLAQAYACRDVCRAFAICDEDEVVGFILLQFDKKENFYDIWRIMIGKQFQGKGYGEQALLLAIDFLKKQGAKVIHMSHQTNNYGPSKLYQKVGFKYTGKIEDGEVLMEYHVSD
ncbi:GNAT family N-acetyltransferase [Mariniplasma anaerobium]|uniref:N-acetyltransferase n=1 Tax=Mariniplasma anaerobium TaxID=2735436 RepID=A0A7U9TGT8_9MOLU|nr:GNAT family N-acetyltransferase [Mariniplasma anaerobium]BCR35698.1 N-acetyltransferase [Mariniplasma anaerobium]